MKEIEVFFINGGSIRYLNIFTIDFDFKMKKIFIADCNGWQAFFDFSNIKKIIIT